MTEEDHGTRLRRLTWRQGSILSSKHSEILDGLPFRAKVAVVLSQDCDVVQACDKEHQLELMGGEVLQTPDPATQNARHPRQLCICCDDGHTYLRLDVRHRCWIEKARLTGVPDDVLKLDRSATHQLAAWVAKRYTRPAFPDAFNDRLPTAKLDTLTKRLDSAVVSGIWLHLEPRDEDLPADTPYRCTILFTIGTDRMANERELVAANRFAQAFVDALQAPGGIVVEEHGVLPHSEFTLDHLAIYSRLDYDARSLAPKPGGAMAPLNPQSLTDFKN